MDELTIGPYIGIQKKMITRTFLLLLALLSGLSVAQARDIVPAEQDVAGWSAVDVQREYASADYGPVAVLFTSNETQRIDYFLPEIGSSFTIDDALIAPSDPLSRADRLLI